MSSQNEPLVLRRHLRIGGVKVLSVQAAIDSDADGDMTIEWSTRADDVGDRSLFVLGQLHTSGLQTRSDIAVVAYCHLDEDFKDEISQEVLQAAAQEGSVPHVLYDIAAAASQQMIGLVQMKGVLPRSTPTPNWIEYADDEGAVISP